MNDFSGHPSEARIDQTAIARRALALLIAATVSGAALAQGASATQPMPSGAVTGNILRGPWSDPTRSPDERAAAALKVMTQQEKIALLRTPSSYEVPGVKVVPLLLSAGRLSGVPRLGIAPVAETDASLGVANVNHLRRGDTATALPASILLGATWNPKIAFQGGAMIGSEARAKGFGVMLSGGVNLLRDPRAGRNFEYISEDPLLTGTLGGHAIAGVQSNRIVSTIKHFALNAQETGRQVYSVDTLDAPAREGELLAFQIANEIGRPHSVMCAYNRVNEIYTCESSYLLNDVLRRDWGYQGWVMSDWGATHSVGALEAGLDQQSGWMNDAKQFFGKELESALAAGKAKQQSVDTAVLRILRSLFAAGVVDTPPAPGAAIDFEANAQVAQRQAEEGIVLLRNEDALLPLSRTATRIAVIGGHADKGVLSGGGSSQVVPIGGFSLELAEPGVPNLKRGYGGMPPLQAIKRTFQNAEVQFADGSDRQAAARLAAQSDIAIVFAEKWFVEGVDATDMQLGKGQDALIESVSRANAKTIVVLETGNPVAMPWQDSVGAILVAWYPGQRGSEAIARVLSGEVNPSGRLPLSWPKSLDQLPLPILPGSAQALAVAGKPAAKIAPFSIVYPEGSDIGYRWFDKQKAEPLYPLGYGMSYTAFRYSDLKVSGGKQLKVSFTVTNRGRRSGADVPQVYVRAPGKAKRLIGWDKPVLAPGESRRVSITADPRLLASFDEKRRRWILPQGTFGVEVGSSATAVALTGSARMSSQAIKP